MKRILAIWVLSGGVLIGGLAVPQRADAHMAICAVQLSWDETWQCDYQAEVVSKVSCGRCIWVDPEAHEYYEGCTNDAPLGCVMVESIEECGLPTDHCENREAEWIGEEFDAWDCGEGYFRCSI